MSKERKKYLKNIKRAKKELDKEWESVRSNATMLGIETGVKMLRKNPKTVAVVGAGLTSFVLTQKLLKKNSTQTDTKALKSTKQANFLTNFGEIGTKIVMQLLEGLIQKKK